MRPANGKGHAPAPRFEFQLVNTAGGCPAPNIIYVTRDSSYNQLSLQIGLTSGSVTLLPGTILDPPTLPDSGATLYIDLSELKLSADVWKKMTFLGTDWTCQKFPDQNVVVMTPTKPVALGSDPSTAIAINISGLVVPKSLATQSVRICVSAFGAPEVSGTYTKFEVAVQGGQSLSQVLNVAPNNDGIINSVPGLTADNQFLLQFAAVGEQSTLAYADKDTLFTVKFVYGDEVEGLTDLGNAKSISVTPGPNAEGWLIGKPGDGNAEIPSWTLKPPNGLIVDKDRKKIVKIEVAKVVTTYPPGTTTMTVSYENVRDSKGGTFEDGAFEIVLKKKAHAQILPGTLKVHPNPAYFSNGKAEVTVSWKTADPPPTLELKQNGHPTTVTGQTQAPASLTAGTTTFQLTATGEEGTVPNTDSQTVTAIALPVIKSFTGAPTEIYCCSPSHDVTLAWEVAPSGEVTLSAPGGAFAGKTFPAQGQTPAKIDPPQMVTLVWKSATNLPTLTRQLVISAFKPTPQSFPDSPAQTAVVASPTGPFVVLANANLLAIAYTVDYKPAATVDIGRPASALAISADGSTIATANADRTVSVVGVALGRDGLGAFGPPSTVELTAVPQQLIFSPDGKRIFVTTDRGAGAPGQVIALLNSSGTYSVESAVDVGKSPRGLCLCLEAAGMCVFVANSGDDTVSMIRLTGQGGLGAATTIQNITGGPTGIAAAGNQLLISCATAKAVVVLDPNHPDTGPRKTLTVGAAPGALAVTPTGAYAFVANGDKTVSLIDCLGQPDRPAVLGPPIALSAKPAGLSIPPDGLRVLVATDGGLTVIALATYGLRPEEPSVPNFPTSVALTPDGLTVFAWGWPQLTPDPESDKYGLVVYNRKSGETSKLLASQKVCGCVVSPNPQVKKAFALALVDESPQFYVVATDQPVAAPFSLDLPSGTFPLALALSGDGQLLFVATTDASGNLSFVVLRSQDSGWVKVQVLALHRSDFEVRLRSTPDGATVFFVEQTNDGSEMRLLRKGPGGYALAPTVLATSSEALDLAVLPDGSTAFVVNRARGWEWAAVITVIDVATLKTRTITISKVLLTGLQPSPDGRRLFAPDCGNLALHVLDPASLQILQTIPLPHPGWDPAGTYTGGLAVASDGSAIVLAGANSKSLRVVEQTKRGG